MKKSSEKKRPRFVDTGSDQLDDGVEDSFRGHFGDLSAALAVEYRKFGFSGKQVEPMFRRALVESLGDPNQVQAWWGELPKEIRTSAATLWLALRMTTYPPMGNFPQRVTNWAELTEPDLASVMDLLVEVDWRRIVLAALAAEHRVAPEVKLQTILESLRRLGVLLPLLEHGSISCMDFVTVERLLKPNPHIDMHDPKSASYWLQVSEECALRDMTNWLQSASGEDLAIRVQALASGLFSGAGNWSERGVRSLYPLLVEVARTDETLLFPLGRTTEGVELAAACLAFGIVFFREGGEVGTTPEGASVGAFFDKLDSKVLEYLGRLRVVLRADGAREELETQAELLRRAVYFAQIRCSRQIQAHVHSTESEKAKDPAAEGSKRFWGILRRLLLLLRELPEPATPADLRTWNEPRCEAVPLPWSIVAEQIAHHLGAPLAALLEVDPEARRVREEFGRFLVDRLQRRVDEKRSDAAAQSASGSPIPSTFDWVEPDPVWREAAVRALRWLQVNPHGRGHVKLAGLADDDVDEGVRNIAKEVSRQMKRGAWPRAGSPRSMLFGAFRELRQAQCLALGLDIDAHGVRETARLEVRRAEESIGL